MTQNSLLDPVFRDYLKSDHAHDELIGVDGQLRLHWENFFKTYSNLGDDEIFSRMNDIQRLLKENGVTYNIYTDPSGQSRPWDLDIIPFIIEKNEWNHLEAGLVQRAKLLNLMLQDIYGERKLIKDGIIPLDLIHNHPYFLRQCAGIKHAGKHQLIVYAADIARSVDGRVWVVNDRTQAPSGSGYALENRTTMARTVPELFSGTPVRHLSPYFNALRKSLSDIAPKNNLNPRIVILTPGSSNETFFEHSYLSSHLGFTLVQGNDLVVRNNYVWLRTIAGLEKIDVILRRVDDTYCDPLELKEDSQLGIPGLLQVIRSGNVSIANPLGSGILENQGLMPFLQPAARYLLSENLIIPTIATWWCGQPKEMNYVLEHLNSLVIKPIHRSSFGSSSIDGASLSEKETVALKQRIKAMPTSFVGQEKVQISHTPALINGKIEARQSLFRSFLVSNNDTYLPMSGGLCRTSNETGNFLISSQAGGFSKDAWIAAPEPERNVVPLKDESISPPPANNEKLPSHAAENLFWVGRYTERILGNARFLRTILQFISEGNKLITDNSIQTERSLLRALTQYSFTYPGFAEGNAEAHFKDPKKELIDIILNEKRPGSLKYNFLQFRKSIYEVRDHWSIDTWRIIRGMEEAFDKGPASTQHGYLDMLHLLDGIITSIVAFIGLNRESISREEGWIMLDLGRKIEQSLLLVTILRVTMVRKVQEEVSFNLCQSVLMSHESLVSYRYKYRMPVEGNLVLDLMLFDPNNPRSLVYQVDRLKNYLTGMPAKKLRPDQEGFEKLINEADSLLKEADRSKLLASNHPKEQQDLEHLLSKLFRILSTIPNHLSRAFFKHEMSLHTGIQKPNE